MSNTRRNPVLVYDQSPEVESLVTHWRRDATHDDRLALLPLSRLGDAKQLQQHSHVLAAVGAETLDRWSAFADLLRLNRIQRPVLFASRHGLGLWRENIADRATWIVHSSSEMQLRPGHEQSMRFAPRWMPDPYREGGYRGDPDLPDMVEPVPAPRVFCGGRTMRDHVAAYRALRLAGVSATMVSDVLPPHMESTEYVETCRARFTPGEYRREIEAASMVLVPVLPGHESHGHADIVRAYMAGRPVVVPVGGSCNEYVPADDTCGVLCDSLEPASIAGAIWHVAENHSLYSSGARRARDRHTWEAFRGHLEEWMREAE